MPALVRLYLRQIAIGFALAAVFTGLLIGLDIARLGHLVFTVPGGGLAAFLLFFFNGLVFAGVQFGIAVMGLAERPRGRGHGRRIRSGPVPDRPALRALPVRR